MSEKLKIALFCDSFYPMVDGVINVVDNYAKILAKKHDVTVFVPASYDEDYKDNFPYKVVRTKIFKHKIGDYNLCLPGSDKNLKKILKEEKFDIVHFHSPFTMGKCAVKYAKKHKIPAVSTLHSQFHQDFLIKTKSKLLTKIMVKYITSTFNGSDELWTMNTKLVDLVRSYGYKGKVFILPNGCDLKKENLVSEQVESFRADYAKPNEKVLLYVGRMHKLKNLEFSLNVCKKLKEKNFPFKFVMVGEGQDFEYFKKLVTKLNLEDVVTFVGRVTDRTKLQYFYAMSDLLLFPSNYDTDGIVKTEAAAFETPTIFLKDSIASSCCQDNVNGYIEKDDVEIFANRIIEIFKDKEQYSLVCKNAERDLFKTWEDIVAIVEENYLRVIDEYSQRQGEKNERK